VQTYKPLRTPRVRVAHACAKACGVRRSDLCVGRRAREPHLKIRVGAKKIAKQYSYAENYILLAQSVALSPRVRVLRIVPLIDIYLYCHIRILTSVFG
jgi:hypothetical protein